MEIGLNLNELSCIGGVPGLQEAVRRFPETTIAEGGENVRVITPDSLGQAVNAAISIAMATNGPGWDGHPDATTRPYPSPDHVEYFPYQIN